MAATAASLECIGLNLQDDYLQHTACQSQGAYGSLLEALDRLSWVTRACLTLLTHFSGRHTGSTRPRVLTDNNKSILLSTLMLCRCAQQATQLAQFWTGKQTQARHSRHEQRCMLGAVNTSLQQLANPTTSVHGTGLRDTLRDTKSAARCTVVQ